MRTSVCGALLAAVLVVGLPTASVAAPPAPPPGPTAAVSAEQVRSRAALSAAIAAAAQASAAAQLSARHAKELIAAAGTAADQASRAQTAAAAASAQLTDWTRALYMQGPDLLAGFTWELPLSAQVHTSYLADRLSRHLATSSQTALQARARAQETTAAAAEALTRAQAGAREAAKVAEAAAADQAAAAADVARADTSAAAAADAQVHSGDSPAWATVRATGPLLAVASALKDIRPFPVDGANMNARMGEWLASDRTVAPNTARAYALIHLRDHGWDVRQWPCLDRMWWHESGWNPSSGTAGSGVAWGIPQANPGSKMGDPSAGGGPDWVTNPATQINWGLTYISQAYGTPCAAWEAWRPRGWY